MADVIEFLLDDGVAIPVEVETRRSGFQNVSRAGGKRNGDESPRSFREALDRVRPMADQLIERLRGLEAAPDDVAVEFGIKLSGEVGALIASTSTEANFTVKLAWKR